MPYEDGKFGSMGSVSWIGETGEKPNLLAARCFRGGDRPRSESPRDRPLVLPFAKGWMVHAESVELVRLCPWLCS
jgi:hypothetical protein